MDIHYQGFSVPSKALQLPTLFLSFSKYPVTLLMIIKCASRCWPAVRPRTAFDCNQGTETRTSKKSKKENMATHHALDFLPAMSLFSSKIITNIAQCLHRAAYGPGPFIVFVMCHFKQTVNLFSTILLAVESDWVQFVIVMDPWYAWLWTSNSKALPENTRWKERNNNVIFISQHNMFNGIKE